MTTPGTTRLGNKIEALDVLRGLALCGILLVNAQPVTMFQYGVPHGPSSLDDAGGWLQLLVQQRFFPVFSLLFGIGFALLLRSAAQRTDRPRLVLLRRLLVLLPLGVLHQLGHPGEALTIYAIVALIVLLPSSWLPRWMVAAGAVVAVAASVVGFGGGESLVPGMFLLGSALVQFGLIDRMQEHRRAVGVLFALFVAASVPAVAWQMQNLQTSGFDTASAVAGLTMAGAYCTGILLLMRTRARRALQVLFVPLGRTALTCYVTATPMLLLAGAVFDLPHQTSWTLVLTISAVILVGQWIAATLWLRRYRQGPLEWLWRCATWASLEPLRVQHAAASPPRTFPARQ